MPAAAPVLTHHQGSDAVQKALEALAVSASTELCLAVPGLTPDTPLVAPSDGLQSWEDLATWLGARGVRLRLLVPEPDPLFEAAAHRAAWRAASAWALALRGDGHVLLTAHGHRAGSFWTRAARPRLTKARALLAGDPAVRPTPTQRRVLDDGPRLRPVALRMGFAVADRTRGFVLDRASPPRGLDPAVQAVTSGDPDLGAQLGAVFDRVWVTGLDAGGPMLTGDAPRPKVLRHPQGRRDLRLLRTQAQPATGQFVFGPTRGIHEIATAAPELVREATRRVYIEAEALRYAPLVQALIEAARRSAALQVIAVLAQPGVPDVPDRALPALASARVAHQGKALQRLRQTLGDRLALVAPAKGQAPGALMLIDDALALLGDPASTGASALWDTHCALLVRDAGLAARIAAARTALWLGPSASPEASAQVWSKAAQQPDRIAPLEVAERAEPLWTRVLPTGAI